MTINSPLIKSTITPVNILTPQFKANPFPFFAQLRADAPVYPIVLPDKTPIWLVTRYEDVNALMKDERFLKNQRSALTKEELRKQQWVPPFFKPLTENILDLDPPAHTRLRALVHKAFTPRLIEQMRARVQTLVDELIDAAQRKGSMDLIADYALPIPLTIIGEILGVPQKDSLKFHNWSKKIVSVTSRNDSLRIILPIFSFVRYLRGYFKLRRKDLKDDLISALIQAEEAGDQMSDDELLAMVFVLLIAGHETTVNLIGNGMLALMENPGQMEMLRSDPTLIKPAIEELLRFGSPVLLATERYAREDVTLHGVTIPRGGMTFGVLGSANRDENMFANPDTLDITRENNKHLAFGHGIHYCVGAPLARLEGQIAVETLVRRLPKLRLQGSTEALRWRSSLILRGLEALPVTF
jgi:cytochrome P450 PksS